MIAMATHDVETNRPGGSETGREGWFREEFSAAGNQMFDRAKELFHQGNMRHVVIKRDGQTVVQFPLTIGVIGTLLAPQLMALGLAAALLTSCSIEVHRTDQT
jgi:Domain of unknown function (DUF4342)